MMRNLISREKLIKAIVNTPTNSQANTLQGYLDGIATRQLEIIDIINAQPTVDEKEIRDKAINEFIEKLKAKYGCLGWLDEIPYEKIDEITEQMKEVE